ncbi:MAG: glutamate--tRNA ligase family protein, partial [Halieaceae bacterium]
VCVVADMLRGPIELDWGMVDAQILLKSDGMPTYHLANVVDDHLMEITHVIRGEEWINSAPKHQLLYDYFGWEMPTLCHLPLLRNPDKSKLSKRKNPTSILYYQRMGYLPEALLNYLGRMGWSMPDEREKFTLAEMESAFDIQRVSLGGPIFDTEKLKWLNGLWIREDHDIEALAARLREWALNKETLMKILPHAQGRMEVLSDFIPLSAYLLSGEVAISEVSFASESQEETVRRLQFVLWRLEAQQDWGRGALFECLKSLAVAMDLKPKELFAPLFIAIAGSNAAYSMPDSMAILGPDITRARLRLAIDILGGVSKKAAKRLEKEYAALG